MTIGDGPYGIGSSLPQDLPLVGSATGLNIQLCTPSTISKQEVDAMREAWLATPPSERRGVSFAGHNIGESIPPAFQAKMPEATYIDIELVDGQTFTLPPGAGVTLVSSRGGGPEGASGCGGSGSFVFRMPEDPNVKACSERAKSWAAAWGKAVKFDADAVNKADTKKAEEAKKPPIPMRALSYGWAR